MKLSIGKAQSIRDPFTLSAQAKNAFYARVNDSSDWYIALKASPRGCFGLDYENEQQ